MSESETNWISALRHSLIGAPVERRREERRYLKFPVEVKVASGETFSGFSRDLTRLSMGAVVSTPLKVGQQVWISYDYQVGGKLEHVVGRKATVRQCLGYRYAFEFQSPLDL
jgi:hypothetical protein